MDDIEKAKKFFDDNPDIEILEAFVIDANGVPRGKWIPRERAIDVLEKGMAIPRSVYALDIWGRDVHAAGLAEGTGDPDGFCFPVPGTLSRVTWLGRPTAQVLLAMKNPDGTGFYGDPRNVLARVLEAYKKAGLTPVVATELEFYLIDPVRSALDPVRPPHSREGRWHTGQTQVLSISELQDFEDVFHDIATACRAQGVLADTTLRENGPGQYEINLNHVPDALRAADFAVFLKRIVKGVARRHDLDATFMAKPYGLQAGNGMHVHFSVLDSDGRNIYAGENGPSDALMHSVGGLLENMGESMAIFAPHANSYRRLTPDMACPVNNAWGYDNRTTAFRVPISSPQARRVENRLPSSDANPYLALAASLACGWLGIVNNIEPTEPTADTANEGSIDLPRGLLEAVALLEGEEQFERVFGHEFVGLYAGLKRGEFETFMQVISPWEREFLLLNV
ncbi:MAG TPA: glutamine synthetase [Agrobacterium sp.]|nr:glutamine synthetase [Agrobacterium sp.]